ncbi:MAG: NADH-quinone oxidoreductase subunit J [Dehalococcoidia bacterium]|nr:NADH-quinone oxidoreductase subunit J [Dehalococcoidia bacterium]
MTVLDVVFWALAAVAIGSALGVVFIRDLFRAALFLVAAFLAMAGFFIILGAEFLAVVQVLVYAGAISILIIFAIMMTGDVTRGNLANRLSPLALVTAALLLVALVFVAYQGGWRLLSDSPGVEAAHAQVLSQTPSYVGRLLVREFLLPFEVVGTLLLAALIGAIALVREQ